jgi:signal transduction histidine kinase
MAERVGATAAQLRAALAAKDQFLRYIFHEMRVPLNAVSLAVDELHTEAAQLPPPIPNLLDIAAFQVGHSSAAAAAPSNHARALQICIVRGILDDTLFIAKLEVSGNAILPRPAHNITVSVGRRARAGHASCGTALRR